MNHNHSHSHKNKQSEKGKNILFAGLLNIFFVVIEIIAGILTNSVAILSDALHDFGDSVALFSSYFAEKQAAKPKDKKRTFGYARISVFSALFNAVILLSGSVYILIEACKRIFTPESVNGGGMMLVAILGVTINAFAYFRLKNGASINEKVLSWHLLEDVLGWSAVLVGGFIIYLTNWFFIDTFLTIGYTIFIIFGVGKNLKEVFNLLMQGVPDHIDSEKIEATIKALAYVEDIHDVHIWSLDGEKTIFTAHVLLKEGNHKMAGIKEEINDVLHHSKIEHSTIEYETINECGNNYCK